MFQTTPMSAPVTVKIAASPDLSDRWSWRRSIAMILMASLLSWAFLIMLWKLVMGLI